MATIPKNQGDSITIHVITDETITLSDINEMVIFCGIELSTKLSLGQITQVDNLFVWKIPSENTRLLRGIKDVTVGIDLEGYGVRKVFISDAPKIDFKYTNNTYNNESVSPTFVDLTIALGLNLESLEATDVVASVYYGKSALQLFQEEQDWPDATRDDMMNYDFANSELVLDLQNNKIDKVAGKELSENDFTDAYKSDVEANTSDRHSHSNKVLLDTYTQTEVNLADAVTKKHSHANQSILDDTTASFLTADETKLDGIATGATANSSDATLLARANHTGTQLASTISDFNASVDARITGKLDFQISATYLAIGAGTTKRLIVVTADETNDGLSTLYFHDGVGLQWVVTQILY